MILYFFTVQLTDFYFSVVLSLRDFLHPLFTAFDQKWINRQLERKKRQILISLIVWKLLSLR